MALKTRRGKKKGEEGYGQGRASIAFDDDVLLDEETMVAALTACFEAPDYQPPTLPVVAMELLELSRQTEVDFADVVNLLEQDSLIAGRILKLVRSPVYAGAVEITSLHDALARLGLRTLRDLVLQISLNMKVFRSTEYAETMDLLRRHSAMTANIAKIIGGQIEGGSEYAFMAGLLHDVGIAGILAMLAERRSPKSPPPDLISVWPAIDRVHVRAGELMAEHWGLADDLRCVLANHHQVLVEGEAHPLSAAICIADETAREMGFGLLLKEGDASDAVDELRRDCIRSHTGVDSSSERTLEHARGALNLDAGVWDKIREQVSRLAEGSDPANSPS